MAIKLHKPGYEKAETMIRKGVEVNTISNNWHEVKPDADDALHYLKAHSLDEYGLWFLGIDTAKPANDSTKFVYPYGDFEIVQQSGIMAAEEQAKKSGNTEIAAAAHELLKKIIHSKKA